MESVIYYPGKKFFRDSKAKATRRDLAAHIENGTHELEAPQPTLMDEKSLLLEDILAVCGDRQNEASYRKLLKQYHIPTDLVVAQEASPIESSSRLDFLLLHNLGMSFVAP
jgi:hypothetical protein